MSQTTLPIDSLSPNPGQPRKAFESEPLEELAASIAELGIVEPLIVRPVDGAYQIVAGERRWRAAQIAGLTEVPVVIRDDLDDRAAFELSMVENVIRRDMNPMEEARGYETLITMGLDVATISKRIGKTTNAIRVAMSLLTLDPLIADLVEKRHLTAWDGGRLATLTPNGQHRALQVIQKSGLTGQDRDRVIGQIWAEENQAGMFNGDVALAKNGKERKATTDLRTAVEQAARAVSAAAELAEAAEADEYTIALAEQLAKATAQLTRITRRARTHRLIEQTKLEVLTT